MIRDDINNEYFDWLVHVVSDDRYSGPITYNRLLMTLHDTEFKYSIPMDRNRFEDGIDLRYRFSIEHDYDYAEIQEYLDGPCSVLEMMVALSIRCEDIMDDPAIGNRIGQWFWGMNNSLGLGTMYDDNFSRVYVEKTLKRFLDRDYASDGKGGLFTIKHCEEDLRDVEIWHQLCWYLDSIMGY